jgi:hypothetical protein
MQAALFPASTKRRALKTRSPLLARMLSGGAIGKVLVTVA